MFQDFKKLFLSARLLVILLTIAVSIYLLQTFWGFLSQFSDVFLMLICAWLLSFLLEPLVDSAEKYTHLPRTYAALIIYIIFLSLIILAFYLFIPVVATQIQQLLPLLPKYFSAAPPFVNSWIVGLSRILDNSLPFLSSIAQFIFSLFIVIIISFYFNVDRDRIRKELYHFIPKTWQEHARFVETVINTTFASFLRLQFLLGILSGFATWLILRLFVVDFAASTAFLSGLLTIIPLIGGVLGLIPPLLVALIESPTKALFVGISVLLVQQIFFNILGPKFFSKALQLHPVIVLLSFAIGYKIAGTAGAIFAIPVFGIITIVLRETSHHFIQNNKKN